MPLSSGVGIASSGVKSTPGGASCLICIPLHFGSGIYEPVNKPEPTTPPASRLQNWISESEAAEFTNDRDETPAATLTDPFPCRSTPQAGADMDHTAPPGITARPWRRPEPFTERRHHTTPPPPGSVFAGQQAEKKKHGRLTR